MLIDAWVDELKKEERRRKEEEAKARSQGAKQRYKQPKMPKYKVPTYRSRK